MLKSPATRGGLEGDAMVSYFVSYRGTSADPQAMAARKILG